MTATLDQPVKADDAQVGGFAAAGGRGRGGHLEWEAR